MNRASSRPGHDTLFLQKVGLHEVAIFKASAVLGLYKKRKLRIAYTIQQFIYLLLILLRCGCIEPKINLSSTCNHLSNIILLRLCETQH